MLDASLACTVRGCGLPLSPAGRAVSCERGHAYDIARAGYLNLLQPQDRRSIDSGDSKDVVAARSRLMAAGFGVGVVTALCDLIAASPLPEFPLVLDLGCGSGDALAALSERRLIRGVGIDISAAAVEHAAKMYPEITWVAANADRRLPILDATANVVLSMHGRRHPQECARVLAPGGVLIVAISAADDLIELRAAVQGEGVERDRVDALIAEHE